MGLLGLGGVRINEIVDVKSEAGIIATLIQHPDYVFYGEKLKPGHFSNALNSKYYAAIEYLAKKEIPSIDSYNISIAMSTLGLPDAPSTYEINDFLDSCQYIARSTVEEYRILVNNVLDKAFRRDLHRKLQVCEKMCANFDGDDLRKKVYESLDNVMMDYSSVDDIPPIGKMVDSLWEKIENEQNPEKSGFEFKFPSLNKYLTIDRGELAIFAARAKRGKSMLLMNLAVDLLRKGKSVLYLDSELSSKNFLLRLMSHIAQVEYVKIKRGLYSPDEERALRKARDEIRSWKLIHKYLPIADEQTIYGITKQVHHTHGVDVLILDYLKSKKDGDAFSTYQEMGRVADLVKNVLAGDMDIAALSAVQLTRHNTVADSANIERSLSSLIYIMDKSIDEIETDGAECGNYKLFVALNRNGNFMQEGEYIDIDFNGNLCTMTEVKQHRVEEPV